MTDQRSAQQPASSWPAQRNLLVVAVLVDALLAGVLVASGTGQHLRPIAVFVFFMLGPGLAITGFLRLPDARTELTLAIPLSLALGVAVAGGMSVAATWRPYEGLLVSVLVTMVALGLQICLAIAHDITNWFG